MIDDGEIISVVEDKSNPVCTTSEVAAEFSISQRGVHKRLKALAESGDIASKSVGARAIVWWVPGSVERTPDSSVESTSSVERTGSVEGTGEPTDGGGVPSREVHSTEVPSSEPDHSTEPDPIGECLDGWRPGKAGSDDREDRIQAGRAAIEYIREQGEHVSAQDIKDALYETHRIGGQKPDSWYDRVAKPALNRAKDAGLIELVAGHWEYEWVGPE